MVTQFGMAGKVNFKDALRPQEAFLKREEIGRPILGCTLGAFAHHHLPNAVKALPKGVLQPGNINIDLFLEDCENLYKGHQELGDDFPFVAAPCTFIPWMEAIMGCPIHASGNSIWAEPCIDDLSDWKCEKNLADNPWTRKLLELTDVLVKRSAGRFPVALTLMRGPADIMSAMRGPSVFPIDMIDEPGRMKEIAEQCTDAFIQIARLQHEHIPDEGWGYMDGDKGMKVWMPYKYVWIQEDAMALLSPDIYRDVFYEIDSRITDEFGHSAFHLHATALWAVDELLKIKNLDVIELNYEDAASDVEGTFKAWKKIQKEKPLVIWGQYNKDFDNWMRRVLDEIPSNGVSLQISAVDYQEALEVKEHFLRLLDERTKRK
jgi:hypothetical protein